MELRGSANWRKPRARGRLWWHHAVLCVGGTLVGGVATLYAWLIDIGHQLFLAASAHGPWVTLLLSPALGALAVWLTHRYFDGAEGSGIPQIVAIVSGGNGTAKRRLLRPAVIVGKIGLSFLGTLGGFTLGRQGPTVHIGAALLVSLRRWLPGLSGPAGAHLTALDRQLALAGASAGLSAAFCTPLAGIAFAIEELARGIPPRGSAALIAVVVCAGTVAGVLQGEGPALGMIAAGPSAPYRMAVAVVTAGAVAGLAGAGFCWLLVHSERWLPPRIRGLRAQRPAMFGALCGLGVALLGLASSGTSHGSGYGETRALLAGDLVLPAAYPFLKGLSLLLTWLSGIPGGLFVPSLAIGAGIGNLLQYTIGQAPLPVYAALAMCGYLAAVTQRPVTAFVVMIELVGARGLTIPLMATALIAAGVSRMAVPPLYAALSGRYAPATATGSM
ncbi:chloride channel protein [Burkholderia multivorans]|uniref:Voltage gated Cl-channel n=4 Tax=Pseudomonadota TaxID=1224 RepID=J9RU28_BURCE|nr:MULTISPECIES: chloride channel protein [Burkholderia cepacia complex]AFR44253.1 voltage gated Cl- channel [Burkholderia cepacia]MBU9145454.1 chloride channel protein [Burkholderia multivorans]HEF4774380.1 chloride channel protein [Burkholderia multivorans]